MKNTSLGFRVIIAMWILLVIDEIVSLVFGRMKMINKVEGMAGLSIFTAYVVFVWYWNNNKN